MATITSMQFVDQDSGDDAFVAVRVDGQIVGLALSLKSGGDVEVCFGRDELTALISALERAAAELDQNSSAI